MNDFTMIWEQSANAYIGKADNSIQAVFEYTEKPQGVCIHLIFVPVDMRRKGYGTKALQQTIAKIKEVYPGEAIYTLAMPMDSDFPLNALKKWYDKNNFVPVLDMSDSTIMVYGGDNENDRNKTLETIEQARRQACSGLK